MDCSTVGMEASGTSNMKFAPIRRRYVSQDYPTFYFIFKKQFFLIQRRHAIDMSRIPRVHI
jgi:hypothetical protein